MQVIDNIQDLTQHGKTLDEEPVRGRPRGTSTQAAKVVGSPTAELWDVLVGAYSRLGFGALDDEGFRTLAPARMVEPTSKAESIRVLDDIAAPHPALSTLFRSLKRSQEFEYRDLLATARIGYRTQTTELAARAMRQTDPAFSVQEGRQGPPGRGEPRSIA